MKKVTLALALLLLLIFLIGCTTPEEIAKADPTIANFLEEHPDAELKSITKMTPSEFEEDKNKWEEQCEKEIDEVGYFVIVFEDEETRLTTLFETSRMKPLCGYIEQNINDDEINITIENNSDDNGGGEETSDNEEDDNIENENNDAEDEDSENDEETIVDDDCQETWICTDWGSCVGGKETRECQKINDCGYNSTQETERDC